MARARMKWRWVLSSGCIAAVLVAACGGDDGDGAQPQTGDTARPPGNDAGTSGAPVSSLPMGTGGAQAPVSGDGGAGGRASGLAQGGTMAALGGMGGAQPQGNGGTNSTPPPNGMGGNATGAGGSDAAPTSSDGAGGSSQPSPQCLPPSTLNCSESAPCCEGSTCIVDRGVVVCAGNCTDGGGCASGCCAPLDATTSVCVPAELCLPPPTLPVCAPTVLAEGFYDVTVTRESQDLYSFTAGAVSGLIETQFCFQFVFFDSAILEASGFGFDTIHFSSGSTCDVVGLCIDQ